MPTEKRLRIAVLSRNFSTTGGGAERYSIAMVEALAQRHEVHVFAQSVNHAYAGVVYHRIALPLRKPRWINQLYFAWATWRATRSGFDVVHSHENTWHGNAQTVHVLPIKHNLFVGRQGLSRALRWVKVLSSPRLLAYLWLEKRRYVFAPHKRVVCASPALRSVLAATYPVAVPMLEVVTPGVDAAPGRCSDAQRASERQRFGLPTSGVLLLFVGNDFVKKGLLTLLEALAQLPADYRLAVVGQAENMQATQALVQRQGLADRVYFLGHVADMASVYAAADLLAHPTREDSYGMVVLEAMAHGLPVVVSDVPYCGIAQDLTHEHHALLLPAPHDASALAAAVTRIGAEPALARALSAQATLFAQAHTWQRAAADYEVLYQRVARPSVQRWLVLAHAFNMDGRAASQTITDKLPHLEAAGIELVVLSGVSGRKDAHFEHHQLWPAGPAGIRFELRHVLRKRLSSPLTYRCVMLLLSIPLLPLMVVEKLLRRVESSWSWWLSAYVKARWLGRKRSFDRVYSTGGAFAAHVAGRALQKAWGVPWLAEVHDPLVMPATLSSAPRTPQERMQAEIERMVCTHADTAIWFTDQALASAVRRHPQLAGRGHVVLPGIDAPFAHMPLYQPSDKLRIGHFGALSTTRNLLPILRALEWLQATQPAVAADIELQVYGGPLDAVSQSALAASPARAQVHHFGRIEANPHTGQSGRSRILAHMRAMDVLLLLHGTEPICAEYIPSKMYEYLWMQRPILALVHRNPQMAQLLMQEGHCVLLDTATVDDTAQHLGAALKELHRQWQQRGLPDNQRRSPYTTQATVRRLLEVVQLSPSSPL